MKTRNKHRGSSLDTFLKKENLYEDACEAVAQRILAEESSEMLRAIDEADASSPQQDLSAEEVSARISQWAHSK